MRTHMQQHIGRFQISVNYASFLAAKHVQVEHSTRHVLTHSRDVREHTSIGVGGEKARQIARIGKAQQETERVVVHGKAEKVHNVCVIDARHFGQNGDFARERGLLFNAKRNGNLFDGNWIGTDVSTVLEHPVLQGGRENNQTCRL